MTAFIINVTIIGTAFFSQTVIHTVCFPKCHISSFREDYLP